MMHSKNRWQLTKIDYLILLPILGLAFYLAFIPHLYYPYPVHIDEWVHLANSEAILNSGSTTFAEPFFGQPIIGLTSDLELGFQLFWGVFQAISGLPWMTVFRFFPSIIFVITVLAVFIMARREGFGWEAAFFASLIPTTVGILGPAFLVPVATGLLFTPLILFLAFNFRTIWSYLVIFVFICFLLLAHAPSAVCPAIVMIPYILLNLKGNFKHSLGMALVLFLPFLGTLPWIFALSISTAQNLFVPQSLPKLVQIPRIIETYGYLPIGLSLLGTFLLTVKGGKKSYGLVLGLVMLLVILFTFFSLHYGVSIVYERGLMFLMLMLGIFAGAGLAGIRNLKLSADLTFRPRATLITRIATGLLCLGLVSLALTIAIPNRLNIPYYRMIDDQDYEAFVWIKDNIGMDANKAILDPWKATAFTAITGKYVYTRIHTGPDSRSDQANAFLKNGSTNDLFLKENGITIIYTRVYDESQDRNIEYVPNNPTLVELRKDIYLVKK